MGQEPKISQIRYDKKFIKALIEKLKVGNRRGIHLNALPGRYAARLDISCLNILPGNKHEEFFNKLLTEEDFDFKIDFEGVDLTKASDEKKKDILLLARRLDNITYEVEDQFLEFGVKNFGFGYPLLIKRDVADPSKVIKAPLLIWSLEIIKSNRKSNEWVIKRKSDMPVVVNELLRSHVLRDTQVEIETINDEILEDKIIDREELREICSNILEQLNSGKRKKISASDMKIRKCPTSAASLDKLATDNAWIQWSGIFGIYRSRKESIIKRGEELLENIKDFINEPLKLEKFRTSTVSSVETDPSKEELINTLTDEEIKTIQGPPGTGKSQALTGIITNILQNEGKCLVVCEKKTALDVIYENLRNLGLEDLCVVIDDVNKDRSHVVRKARNRSTLYYDQTVNNSDFEKEYSKYIKLRDEINLRHQDTLTKTLGSTTWKDAIGHYIHFSLRSDFKILKNKLGTKWLSFSEEEYVQLKEKVLEGQALYFHLVEDDKILVKNFDPKIFKDSYSVAARDIVNDLSDNLSSLALELHNLINKVNKEDTTISGISIFNEKGVERAISNTLEILNIAKQTNLLLSNKGSFNKGWKDEMNVLRPRIKDKIYSLVDKNLRLWLRKKIKYIKSLRNINSIIEKNNTINTKIVSVSGDISLEKSFDELKNLIYTKELQLKKLKSILSLRKKIIKIESKINKVISFPFIYKFKAEIKNNREWTKYEKSVGEFLKDCKTIKSAITNYEHHHKWRHFFQSIRKNERNLVNLLSQNHKDEWVDVFSAWYFYALIVFKEREHKNPLNDSHIKQLASICEWLKSKQPEIIKNIWANKLQKRKDDYEESLGTSMNLLYNLRRNSRFSRTNSLRKIIESDFNLFTSIFPIILTNPIVVDSIFPLKKGLFEVVMFDEASQLRIEDIFTSFIRGRFKIVAGDKHQMPPSSYFQAEGQILKDVSSENNSDNNQEESSDDAVELALSESLLDYVDNFPLKKSSYLDYHYRSKHPALIEFSNQAFYGGNLVPFPAPKDYIPIEIKFINGIWKDGINNDEAVYVLELLSKILPGKSGKFPSVGIATLNVHQRNKIIDLINKQETINPEFANKIEGIRASGLFVKNLENIQGDEKDIIIISTTYGPGPDNRFFERYGPINHTKGYKLLNVIITRAKYKVYICTSIPRDKFENYKEYLDVMGNNKKAIFYAYLSYAESISNQDSVRTQTLLKNLHENTLDASRSKHINTIESPFEQEVYDLLCEHYPSEQIKTQFQVGGFRIDFVLNIPGREKPVAIECDGKTYHSSNEAYAYDSYREKELRNIGFDVYRVWSTNWWHDHEREFKKMIRYIDNK